MVQGCVQDTLYTHKKWRLTLETSHPYPGKDAYKKKSLLSCATIYPS